MTAPTAPPKRTKRMTMKLPSMHPLLYAAPQHPRHVKRERKAKTTMKMMMKEKYVAVGLSLEKDGSMCVPMRVFSALRRT